MTSSVKTPSVRELAVALNDGNPSGAAANLAKVMRVDPSLASRWVNLQWAPRGERLKRMSRLFGVSMEAIRAQYPKTRQDALTGIERRLDRIEAALDEIRAAQARLEARFGTAAGKERGHRSG